jgi:filamentous hemagglutinin
MAKLQASKPIVFQFALYVRLQLSPWQSKKGWLPKFNSPVRYEEGTDASGNRSSIFYFDQDQSLFENVESLISYLLKDSAFWEWKKQQPPPPPSIDPAPGTPEADEAKREARIRFMQKAGATEQEIASYELGLLGSDLFGPGGKVWSALEAVSPAAAGRGARRRQAMPSRGHRGSKVGETPDGIGRSPRTPVGRSGQQNQWPNANAPAPRNQPININGIDYSGHAIDRMQERGYVPSVVENAIRTGTQSPGKTPGTTIYTDSVNQIRVVRNTDNGRVVTIMPGVR